VAQWRQALRVVGGEIQAAAQVRVRDTLPDNVAGFTGRTSEVDRLRRILRPGSVGRDASGDASVVAVIEGMAGVGKTELAAYVGRLINRETPFERVLFVNLRGFHPAQPPADPAAVLDGFLRVLGMPDGRILHDLDARVRLYRDRLADTRALVVLDDAASADQVRPLLPIGPGCLTLITSRRGLSGLHPAVHVAVHVVVDVLTSTEATAFLGRAAPGVPTGDDPDALARIARRCAYLPLALALVAGHMRAKPDWTITDHADRLDERHRDRRLDSTVELALGLSYQRLPADRRRLLRLFALCPAQEVDAYATAALVGADLPTSQDHLNVLCRDHLLQQATPGRYSSHDLVRVRRRPGQRRRQSVRPPCRVDPTVRLLPGHRGSRDGSPVPGRS
jgi:NB-ARC domain